METKNDCIPCLISQGEKVSEYLNLEKEKRAEILNSIKIIVQNYEKSTPPELAKRIYREIYKIIENNDPYQEAKSYFNKEMLKMEEDLKRIISEAENQFVAAIKLVITGNIIDFGPKHKITKELIFDKINAVKHTELAIDNSNCLYEKLSSSKTLLYLGDNCGEIVFDKVFIEYLKSIFPDLEIVFAVRGRPIINDATIYDAFEVGLNKIVKIVDNGDDAPGTIIADTKNEFKKMFYNFDLVIAKGQGNYETLSEIDRENVFFLFMAKCNVISEKLQVEKMSLISIKR